MGIPLIAARTVNDPKPELAVEQIPALLSTHEIRNAFDRRTNLRSSGSTRTV
jgi:hypothetical protein